MQAHQSKRRSKQQQRSRPHGAARHSAAAAAINTSFGSHHHPPARHYSEFQLISPLSDLSNPSFSAFHKNHRIPTPKENSRSGANNNKPVFILENLPPPDRISKNRTHVLANNAAAANQGVHDSRRDNHVKKNKASSKPRPKQPKKLKNKLATYLTGGAHQLKVQTTRAVKQTSTAVKHGATAVAKKVQHNKKDQVETEQQHHHQRQPHHATLNHRSVPTRQDEAATTLWSVGLREHKNNRSGTLGLLTSTKGDTYFESLWRDTRTGMQNSLPLNNSISQSIGQQMTPAVALNRAFEDTIANDDAAAAPANAAVGPHAHHRPDDYFHRLAESNQSPTMVLDQMESLASVNYEDATCVSYLISEPSQDDEVAAGASTFSLSSTTEVTEANAAAVDCKQCDAHRVSVESAETSDTDNVQQEQPREQAPVDAAQSESHASADESSLHEESDEPADSRLSLEAVTIPMEELPRTSHASSNLVYSPETIVGECPATDIIDSAKDVQESTLKNVQSHPSATSESDVFSPVQLMGELVSLGSDKSLAHQSTSPRSMVTSSTLTRRGSCEEISTPPIDDESSTGSKESATKLAETRHHIQKESYSSLPVRQDTSTVPFAEEGISAIVEHSIVNLPDHHDHDESELELNCAAGDIGATESCARNQVDETILEQDESELIVAISKLPKTDEESVSSSNSSDSAQPPQDATESIVSVSRLTKDDGDSLISESSPSQQDETESFSYSSEMLGARLSYPTDLSGPAPSARTIDSHSAQESASQLLASRLSFPAEQEQLLRTPSPETLAQQPATVEEEQKNPPTPLPDCLSDEESACTAEQQDAKDAPPTNTSNQEKQQEKKVVKAKTAIATGRVFAPRSPGGLLRSIDMGTVKSLSCALATEHPACDDKIEEVGSEIAEPTIVDSPVRAKEPTPIVLETINNHVNDPSTFQRAAIDRNQISAAIPPRHERFLSADRYTTPALDYRKILTRDDDQKGQGAPAPVVNPVASVSPSMDSVASSDGSPLPLVSDQALSNAAFLFSPSYAGGEARLLTRANPAREMHLSTFAICTAKSRSRLSTFSARSRPAFSIPISSAPLNMSSIRKSYSSYSYEDRNDTQGAASSSTNETVRSRSEGGDRSTEANEKHVHFSSANECFVIREENQSRVAMGTPVTVVSPPAIDRKISDLTEATISLDVTYASIASPKRQESAKEDTAHPQNIARILQEIEEDENSVEGSVKSESVEVITQREGAFPSSNQSMVSWTYREEDGIVGAATPLRSNARPTQGGQLAPTNSPMLRYQEARSKFSKPLDKVPTRTRTLPSVKYTKSVDNSGAVLTKVTELNGRLRRNRQPVRKNPRRETGGENALAPRQATLEAPLFRNPVIMTYKDDSSVTSSSYRNHSIESGNYSFADGCTVSSGETKSDTGVSTVASTVVSADVKSDTGVSTVVSAGVDSTTNCASLDVSLDEKKNDEGDDIFASMMSSPPSPPPEEREYPYENMSSDSEEDDVFADVRRQSKLRSSSAMSLESLLSRDKRSRESKCPSPRLSRGPLGTSLRSLVSEDPSALTLDTRKENSAAPSLGTKGLSFTDKATVNPHKQQQHAPPGALCLSPTQRTPLQARKWRSLAAAAQEKNGSKKGGSKKQLSRKGLKERNSNVMIS